MARMPDLKRFARRHGLQHRYRRRHDPHRLRDGAARRARGRDAAADAGRRDDDLSPTGAEDEPDEHVALVKGPDHAGGARPCPRPRPVRDRRCLRLAALRLWRAEGRQPCEMIARARRRLPLHAAGGARHRTPQQDPRLRPPGPGHGYRGREPRPRLSRPTAANTASACRSSSTSASVRCGSSRTIPASARALRRTGSRSWSEFRSRSHRTRSTSRYLETKRPRMGHILDELETLTRGDASGA